MSIENEIDAPMTREEASAFAQHLWGLNAVVGDNQNYTLNFYVGERERGVWIRRGVGSSWEESFLHVRDYPDGHLPITHHPVRPDR